MNLKFFCIYFYKEKYLSIYSSCRILLKQNNLTTYLRFNLLINTRFYYIN